MTTNNSQKASVNNFFQNYNRLVGATYISILVLTLGFFLFQLYRSYKDETEIIRGHLNRHAQFIEFTLRSSVNQLEALRISTSEFYTNTAGGLKPTTHSPLFSQLAQKGQGFNLDAVIERDRTGNLTGLGALKGRSERFYQDIEMALNLNQIFQAIAFNLPNAVETRFISTENFTNTYPWIESSKRPFVSSVYNSPTWRLGTPEQNPDHLSYWAPVYYSGIETGLLVPVAAPVYSNSSPNEMLFRGVVSIDTSLDYLNRINSDFGYKTGTVFLIDEFGQVLAHPELFKNEMEVNATRPLSDVLPPGMFQDNKQLLEIKPDMLHEISGQLIIRHQFVSAPWQLVYIVPQKDIWTMLVLDRGPLMLLVIIGLTAMMVVTSRVTSREFISPASKLVAHIASASQFVPTPIPAVPSAWRPWFETISKAFSESLQLLVIRQELDIAAKMQFSILPQHWPVDQRFSLWGMMRSAKEIGGDFYDHFTLEDGKIGVVVADVSGKGVPAALFGMVSKTLLHVTATRGTGEPGITMEESNNTLCEDNDACNFVTTFYAVFDPANGNFTYVNGGHPPPLLLHADGSSEFLAMTGGCPLGVMEEVPFAQKNIILLPGDCVLMYTDGVTEAFNPEYEEFTQERIPPLFTNNYPDNVHIAVETVIAAVQKHADTAPQSDDITCVALRYHNGTH